MQGALVKHEDSFIVSNFAHNSFPWLICLTTPCSNMLTKHAYFLFDIKVGFFFFFFCHYSSLSWCCVMPWFCMCCSLYWIFFSASSSGQCYSLIKTQMRCLLCWEILDLYRQKEVFLEDFVLSLSLYVAHHNVLLTCHWCPDPPVMETPVNLWAFRR